MYLLYLFKLLLAGTDILCFWWPWWGWEGLIRSFVEYPLVGIYLIFSLMIRLRLWIWEVKITEVKCPFSMISQHDQSLLMVNLTSWHCKVTFLSSFSVWWSLERSHYAQLALEERGQSTFLKEEKSRIILRLVMVSAFAKSAFTHSKGVDPCALFWNTEFDAEGRLQTTAENARRDTAICLLSKLVNRITTACLHCLCAFTFEHRCSCDSSGANWNLSH